MIYSCEKTFFLCHIKFIFCDQDFVVFSFCDDISVSLFPFVTEKPQNTLFFHPPGHFVSPIISRGLCFNVDISRLSSTLRPKDITRSDSDRKKK